ncbi:PAS domain-containing protein [Sphingomonas mucosissima]|uniref:histidine kinase n=1 Tax=Sphingomonas mucosissima TaxID=370959 RepID=A0A245ZJU2_9SPHN|nr:PAS domain-containing protein [Sphingomonas mucosissima]OWK30011.1 blue-light-activated histidine kinase [Sphingomonas mucosissima]
MMKLHEDASLHGDAPVAAQAGMMNDRRELALVAVERTRMPMVVTDPRQPDAPIVLANQAFLDLTGYSSEEVLGRNCRFLQGPGTSADDVDKIRHGLAEGNDVEVELLNYRKDGSSFVNQLAISPVLADDGTLLYYFGSQKDVTERRRAQLLEDTERRLLMEVDHRAMNAMALVQSIVRLSRGDTPEAYAASIQGRVDALACAHRLLAKRSWTGAQLGELVSVLVASRGDTARVRHDGPDVLLGPRLAQPIALVLNELMENALTHGALSDTEGTVSLQWRCDNGRASLEWREWTSKALSAPKRPGFGIGTIKGVISRQLDGSVKLDWTDRGLHVDLAFDTEGSATQVLD